MRLHFVYVVLYNAGVQGLAKIERVHEEAVAAPAGMSCEIWTPMQCTPLLLELPLATTSSTSRQ